MGDWVFPHGAIHVLHQHIHLSICNAINISDHVEDAAAPGAMGKTRPRASRGPSLRPIPRPARDHTDAGRTAAAQKGNKGQVMTTDLRHLQVRHPGRRSALLTSSCPSRDSGMDKSIIRIPGMIPRHIENLIRHSSIWRPISVGWISIGDMGRHESPSRTSGIDTSTPAIAYPMVRQADRIPNITPIPSHRTFLAVAPLPGWGW